MSVKIRLQRRGTTNTPFYKIVVADSRKRRDGRSIEEIGYYDPLKQPAVVKVNRASALRWLRNGAIPSDTVARIFSRVGILSEFQRVRRGEAVPEGEAKEVRIFPARRTRRPSKKTRSKGGEGAGGAGEAAAEAPKE